MPRGGGCRAAPALRSECASRRGLCGYQMIGGAWQPGRGPQDLHRGSRDRRCRRGERGDPIPGKRCTSEGERGSPRRRRRARFDTSPTPATALMSTVRHGHPAIRVLHSVTTRERLWLSPRSLHYQIPHRPAPQPRRIQLPETGNSPRRTPDKDTLPARDLQRDLLSSRGSGRSRRSRYRCYRSGMRGRYCRHSTDLPRDRTRRTSLPHTGPGHRKTERPGDNMAGRHRHTAPRRWQLHWGDLEWGCRCPAGRCRRGSTACVRIRTSGRYCRWERQCR
jgi:hypothetical protein